MKNRKSVKSKKSVIKRATKRSARLKESRKKVANERKIVFLSRKHEEKKREEMFRKIMASRIDKA